MNRGNIILLVICLIAIAVGSAIILEASAFQKTSKVTEGKVVSSDFTYYTVQFFSDDGAERSYRGRHGKPKKYFTGDKVKVFYQADNPDRSRITDGKKSGKKVIGIAILLLILDLYLIYTNKKRNKSATNFKTTGRKVEAEITKIDIDMNTTVLKKHPWFIECRWIDPITGKPYTHTIKNIWIDPYSVLAGRKTIDVYIDRQDPDKYFMDIEFLGDIAK
jgi:hypothetical protein